LVRRPPTTIHHPSYRTHDHRSTTLGMNRRCRQTPPRTSFAARGRRPVPHPSAGSSAHLSRLDFGNLDLHPTTSPIPRGRLFVLKHHAVSLRQRVAVETPH